MGLVFVFPLCELLWGTVAQSTKRKKMGGKLKTSERGLGSIIIIIRKKFKKNVFDSFGLDPV